MALNNLEVFFHQKINPILQQQTKENLQKIMILRSAVLRYKCLNAEAKLHSWPGFCLPL